MKTPYLRRTGMLLAAAVALLLLAPVQARPVDEDLLDILLSNGSITQAQHRELVAKLNDEDLENVEQAPTVSTETQDIVLDEAIAQKIENEVAAQVDAATPIKSSHGSKGFRFESADGNWQTNLQ